MSAAPPRWIKQNEPLAPHTTIGLGGPARFFARCESAARLLEALSFARESGLATEVMSGGSNILFADEGFDGLIIQSALRGQRVDESAGTVFAASGESWDDLVRSCIERGWGGIECLSGIPGSVGATPVQNVGAYGQEVSETIISVRALERQSGEIREFSAPECGFAYRQSRFKGRDAGRFIITEVRFRLHKNAAPDVRYVELQRALEERAVPASLRSGGATLSTVREAVLALRRRKSMVIDDRDPESRSVGSFFMNPVLSSEAYRSLCDSWQTTGDGSAVPAFPGGAGVKVSAAWMVEHAGFSKGQRKGGAAISRHHALALVNRGGSTADVLDLAEDIRRSVKERFGVHLGIEPVIVPFRPPRHEAAS